MTKSFHLWCRDKTGIEGNDRGGIGIGIYHIHCLIEIFSAQEDSLDTTRSKKFKALAKLSFHVIQTFVMFLIFVFFYVFDGFFYVVDTINVVDTVDVVDVVDVLM